MMKWKNKRWQPMWQITVILLCSLALIGMLEYGAQLTQRNYRMLSEQTQTLSQMVVRQAAESAANPIAENNHAKLQALVDQLTDEALILDVAIYSIDGVTLAQSALAMPLTQVTGLSTPLAMASIGRQQIAHPVFANKHVIGFVRITLEHSKLLADAKSQMTAMTSVIRGLIVMALVMGLLLAFTFGRGQHLWPLPFFLTPHTKH